MTVNERQEPVATVTLEEGAMYWVKDRYSPNTDRWTVARWDAGCFWGISGSEVSPSVISGPIPRPAESSLCDGAHDASTLGNSGTK